MKKKFSRYFAFFMAINIIFEVISPTVALALTNGSIQPEHVGFQQADASEMVDLFTGDFSYNIPLLDVDGYPINISYAAGQKMETEASWVGLGWSLNPGVMTRMMRGLPDDFNGDKIKTETHIRDNFTIASGRMTRYKHTSIVSFMGIGAAFDRGNNRGYEITYNNYDGHSLELQLDVHHSIGIGGNGGIHSIRSNNWGAGRSVNLSTKDGATFTQYKSSGHAELNLPSEWGSKGFMSNGVQNVQGTSHNTNSGITRPLYSKTTTSEYGGTIDLNGASSSATSTHMLPTTALSFPPRINQSFTSEMTSTSRQYGIYGCAPIWFVFSIDVLYMTGFPKQITRTKLNDPVKSLKSFGYMNLENADENSIMDFSRHNDGGYMDEMPNSSYASLNNDVFISTAQGMGSNFRALRGDYGIVHDPKIGGNFTGNTEHRGQGNSGWYYLETNEIKTNGTNFENNWDVSPVLNQVKFYKPNVSLSSDRSYEKFFFKEFGEATPVDASYEGLGGGQGTSKPTISSIGVDRGISVMAGAGKRPNRAIRNTHISNLNAKEANDHALDKKIKDFGRNQFGIDASTRALSNYTIKNRLNFNGLTNVDHHLSEMMVTKDDGTRYVYGIPVYNHKSKTVMFNASDFEINGDLAQPSLNPLLKSNYLKVVQYNATDISSSNIRGTDNYFHTEETPAYAQSFLLTGIISPDYVDLTADGPSQDDFGTYMKFNYSNTNEYKWRGPYNVKASSPNEESLSGADKNANFIEGYKSDKHDDKGVFEFGTRDNWYLHSIESKNYVAEFEIDQRDDACGVTGEDGTLDPGSSYKLKQIRLYTKEEKIRAQIAGSTPVPLKTVTFEYDYSLCNGVYNGTSGKLTLKKIFFTQGNSGKLALSPFKFTYADNDHDGSVDANPDYDPRAMDRWGSFKENSTILSNVDFPYSEQDQTKANKNAASWNLTSIETPTGAKTDIYYEADDYSFVQDEPAAVMLKIAGFYSSINKNPTFDVSTIPGSTEIYFDKEALIDLEALNMGISSSLSASDASKIVQTKMFPIKKQLYLKCKTHLTGNMSDDTWEYVPCYSAIEGSGIVNKSGSFNTYTNSNGTFYKFAWVRLKGEKVDKKTSIRLLNGTTHTVPLINPISKAGCEMIRTTFLKLAYPGKIPDNAAITANDKKTKNYMKASIGSWLNFVSGALEYGGQNSRLIEKNFCSQVDYTESWVRAYSPFKKKIGDGYRVKKIVTRDNWNNSGTGETYTDYGQEYLYTTIEGNQIISSGVASYEPMIGGDENSLHQPIKYGEPKGYAPNDHYFQETPYLEDLYPNAMVGYSEVMVKSIDNKYTNGSNTDLVCQVGKTIYKFYTAKDFPAIERKSLYEKVNSSNPFIDNYMITTDLYDLQYTAQGFSLKINDMHGKLRSVMIYGENDLNTPISGTTYYYKFNPINGKGGNELIQTVSSINENLTIGSISIGRNIDVTNDLRYVENVTSTSSNMRTLKYSICNLLGKKMSYNRSANCIRRALGTASTTKVIQQYGILEKIESFNNKAKSTTENILWDYKTGEVILTKVTNNLDQPVYSFKYPAYWINKAMGLKYERQGINYKIDLSITTPVWSGTGDLNPSTLTNIFHLGDEVFIYKELAGTKIGERFWITENPVTPSKWRFMDVNGVILTSAHPDLINNNENLIVKIDRPIERNTQSIKAAGLNTLHNPLTNVPGGTLPILDKKVVYSNAVQYCQFWDYFKHYDNSVNYSWGGVLPYGYDNTQMSNSGNPTINPYSSNILGCWRPYQTYAYNDNRIYDNTQPNIKNDGLYNSYSPYYQRILGVWQTIPSSDINYTKWVKMQENHVYSPNSDLMESIDAQGISHVQRYGFNHSLPVLQASNAKMNEVGFDSFEEYGNLYSSYTATQRIKNDYLGFYEQLNTVVTPSPNKPSYTELQSHTGRASLNFSPSQSVVLTHSLECMPDIEAPPSPPRCDYMGLYKLNKPKYNYQNKYLVSFWIKSKILSTDFSNDFIFTAIAKDPWLNLTGNANIVMQSTKIINGWQKFDYEIDFPSVSLSQNNQAIFTLLVPATKQGFFVDDFRIQPFNSTMVCTVYDSKTLKPWAQMDDQNFATYLEYDNEGSLVRGKKETINGLFTVSETRKSLKK